MKPSGRHLEREHLAAAIKGLQLDEHFTQKNTSATKDDADKFAAWQERFRHELESEFGELPDDDDEISMNLYIKNMKKQFRLVLK